MQGDNSTTRRYGGTGLGLTISKKLAQLMGGDIEVTSELAEGSRFRVCIPFETKAVRIAPLPSWQGLEAAVLSSNNFLNTNVKELLSCKTAKAELFSDPAQCRQKIQSDSPPQLLILQWEAEFTEEFNRTATLAEEKQIPVLWILKDRPDAGTVAKAPYVKLPLRQSTLLRKVSECLNFEHAPARLAPDVETTEQAARMPLTKSPLCLIAEDNSTNQKVLRRMLENLGIKCDVVANGAEAVTAVQNIGYDLVLMDCLMPEMDGYQASMAIRRLPHSRFAELPIVAVTANVSETERARCLQAGMNEYLAKPIVFADLHQILTKWLAKSASDDLTQAA